MRSALRPDVAARGVRERPRRGGAVPVRGGRRRRPGVGQGSVDRAQLRGAVGPRRGGAVPVRGLMVTKQCLPPW